MTDRCTSIGAWVRAGALLAGSQSVLAAPARRQPARPLARAAAPAAARLVRVRIVPPRVVLSSLGPSQRFLVLGHYSDGSLRDHTAEAVLRKQGTAGVRLEEEPAPEGGRVRRVVGTINGEAKLVATVRGLSAAMEVRVQQIDSPPEWSFANEIVPIFTKAGCNTGGCHGSPSGRGGFRLSLFGYEPAYDYEMVVKDRGGARVKLDQPERSLLLLKPTMQVPHGGGLRFKKGSEFYRRILQWLRDGATAPPEARDLPPGVRRLEFDARLSHIEVYPAEATLERAGRVQPIVVMAVRDDGTTQDVTAYARYTSNDDQVAEVDDDGRITAVKPGETSVMVRYLGGVGVVSVKVPRPPLPPDAFARFRPVNEIDRLVLEKLKEVRIPPSEPASDAEFLRRAFLDTCGITPTVEEARAFLDDPDPNKRVRLIDSLLQRPEFVDYWSLRWSDLLRNNPQVKQPKGLQSFYRWIRESVRQNKPYDQFVRELIVASGSSFRNGPVNWYNTGDFGGDYPLLLASATSQVFLGIRIDCARCHNHPFEAWSQMDYYGLAAFFARVRFKNGPDENERVFYAAPDGELRHPRTGAPIAPKFLGGDLAHIAPGEDRRERLAEWITDPNRNPWFARSIANRLWNAFFGRGIVHPVDDYRLTNPASNPKLLDALAALVVRSRFDLKAVMREILLSRTYQTSSTPNPRNIDDRIYASHALPRRLYAEVLLDAIGYATEVPDKLGPYSDPNGRPARAIAVPDNRIGNGFLDLFGRARREVACECERTEDANVSMVLHLINGGTIHGKITHPNGRVARVVKANRPPAEIVEEFYLATLARRPNDRERAAAMKLFSQAPLKEAAEDLMWGLLNTKEFLFNH